MGVAPDQMNSPVVSLPLFVPPVIADVKVEDGEDENATGSVVEISFAARTAYEQLQIAIKYVCMAFKIP